MRPKPLMPTLTGMCVLSKSGRVRDQARPAVSLAPPGGRESISGPRLRSGWLRERNLGSGAAWLLVDVTVDDVDQMVAAVLVDPAQLLGDDHRAVAAAGAPDADGQVGLALLLVGVEQVVEQRLQLVVELVDAVRGLDVLAYVGVEAGLVAELGLVVRVRQEADVEQKVGVARRTVLEAERQERD